MIETSVVARVNIRYNLVYYKYNIVKEVYEMLLRTPPIDPRIKEKPEPEEFAKEANALADTYIKAVDAFLRDHAGAKPRSGQRNAILDFLGIENAQNAPWCADWAGEMITSMGQQHASSKYVGMAWGQWNQGWNQHNFLIVKPRGHEIQFFPDALDSSILFFDPWRDILPKVYRGDADPKFGVTNLY